MYIHMYLYIHICMYMYMYIYICMYTYIYILYICACIYIHTIYMRTYIHVCICIHIIYMHTYIYVFIYIHVHTCTRIHTYETDIILYLTGCIAIPLQVEGTSHFFVSKFILFQFLIFFPLVCTLTNGKHITYFYYVRIFMYMHFPQFYLGLLPRFGYV